MITPRYIPNNKHEEPTLKTGTSTAGVAGVLSLVFFFFPELLSERQTTLILVLAAFVLPLVTALFTRGKVWSPASVQELINEATKEANITINELRGRIKD